RNSVSVHTPGGPFAPMTYHFRGPLRRLVFMARIARIGNLVLRGRSWCDELECVRTDKGVRRPFRLDQRHVAGYALAPGTILLVMRMLFERDGSRPIG